MTEEEYQDFRKQSLRSLMELNERCDEQFSISTWPRWDYDLSEGVLTFSEDGEPKVTATIQVVGTTSDTSSTWMWSWANRNLPENVSSGMKPVLDFGRTESLPRLTTEVLPNDDYLGWEMTAVAAKLLNARGAYCCPLDDGSLYVIYRDITATEKNPRSRSSTVDCGTHGTAHATYVCVHLIENPHQEWFSEHPSEINPWPDSWCAECDAHYLEQNEWNEKNEGKVPITLLCHHCHERARGQQTE